MKHVWPGSGWPMICLGGPMSKRARNNDVVDILQSQHAQIRATFRRAALPGPGRPRAFHQLVRLLAVHEAAEEAHVHPAARRATTAGKAVTRARRAEEKEAKKLLVQLTRIGPHGRGYLRFSYANSIEAINEALRRIRIALGEYATQRGASRG